MLTSRTSKFGLVQYLMNSLINNDTNYEMVVYESTILVVARNLIPFNPNPAITQYVSGVVNQ